MGEAAPDTNGAAFPESGAHGMRRNDRKAGGRARGRARRRKIWVSVGVVCLFLIVALLIGRAVQDFQHMNAQTPETQPVEMPDLSGASDAKAPAVDETSASAKTILTHADALLRIAASADNSGWISGGQATVVGKNDAGQCLTDDWTDIAQLRLGDAHAIALSADGRLLFSGSNAQGQLELDAGGEPVRYVEAGPYASYAVLMNGTAIMAGAGPATSTQLMAQRNLLALAASESHIALLYADGTVALLTDGDDAQADVSSWEHIVAIDCGYGYTIALDESGTVRFAGEDRYGLGGIDGLKQVQSIAAGVNTCYAVMNDGTVRAFGSNGSGQAEVSGWTNVSAVAAGYMHAIALTGDMRLLGAGSAANGRLGR